MNSNVRPEEEGIKTLSQPADTAGYDDSNVRPEEEGIKTPVRRTT